MIQAMNLPFTPAQVVSERCSVTESYGSAAQTSTRVEFSRQFPGRYFCVLVGKSGQDPSCEFSTIGGKENRSQGRELHVFALAKRPGANPFTMMITFGRAPNNDLPIPAGEVSKFHGYFAQHGDTLFVTDGGSTNGIFVEGSRLEVRRPAPVAVGEMVQLGQVEGWVLDGGSLYDLIQQKVVSR